MQQLENATSEEREAVQWLLHQTMPDAVLVRVQRNQHALLYRQYEAMRDAVDATAGRKHERWLWNGNDSIEENISKGFDLRFASMEFKSTAAASTSPRTRGSPRTLSAARATPMARRSCCSHAWRSAQWRSGGRCRASPFMSGAPRL